MSKNTIWYVAQNPLAAMYSLASSNVLDVLCPICSPVSFCLVCFMQASLQTYFSRWVLCLFWCGVLKPLFLHAKVCSMLMLLLHAEVLVVWRNYRTNLVLTWFQNLCLLSMYPTFSIGTMVNRVEAPSLILMMLSLHSWSVSYDLILTSFC